MNHLQKKLKKFRRLAKESITNLLVWTSCEGSSKCERKKTHFRAHYLLHTDIAKFKARKYEELMESYLNLEEEFKSGCCRNYSYDLKRMGDYD